MDDINSEIEQLNDAIILAHNTHYLNSPSGLINPNESPNGNQIYHLYSTGEISYQKGGWAYMRRSEFITHNKLTNYQRLSLVLPKIAADESTYAILTEEECTHFRLKMIELLLKK
jgi:hypothetical protein